MKHDKDWDMEFIDLDDEGQDTGIDAYEEEDEYESESYWGERISLKVLIFTITIVIIIIVTAAVFLLKGDHVNDSKESEPVMEEISGEAADEIQTQDLPDHEDQTGTVCREKDAGEETEVSGQEAEDPQTETMGTEQGTEADETELLSSGAVAETKEALSEEPPEEAQADVEALMKFTEVSEEVTAKDSTNLRNIPSQGSDSTVVYTLQNGETLTRTGVSDSGWSRLHYNGQTVYAVSSYLTADLSYKTPAQEGAGSGDGLKTRFEDRNEQVTAKIEVNLRTLPSVTNPDAAVAAVLHNGEYVTRTGINEAYGWSRVDYNGQTLYCISSYLTQ